MPEQTHPYVHAEPSAEACCWLVGLSAGLIDGLLLLPQDYRSSSPGGEGNSSERSEKREREWERQSRAGTERKGWREGGSTIMEAKIREDRGKGVGKREREGDLGEKRMQDGDGGGKGRR